MEEDQEEEENDEIVDFNQLNNHSLEEDERSKTLNTIPDREKSNLELVNEQQQITNLSLSSRGNNNANNYINKTDPNEIQIQQTFKKNTNNSIRDNINNQILSKTEPNENYQDSKVDTENQRQLSNRIANKIDANENYVNTDQSQREKLSNQIANKNNRENQENFNENNNGNTLTKNTLLEDETNIDQIINLLLHTEVVNKDKNDEAEDKKKQTMKNTIKSKLYGHVQSKYKKENMENDPNYKQGPEKFFILPKQGNPEFSADFEKAKRNVYKQFEKADDSDKILKSLLFLDLDKNKKTVFLEPITANAIKNKVEQFMNKKQKVIDEISNQADEEFIKNCTFKPEIFSEQSHQEKRNLKEFVEDQNNHLKKVNEKILKVNFSFFFIIFLD